MAKYIDIAELEYFTISLTANKMHGEIYMNGRQQLTVHIALRPLNTLGQSIEIDDVSELIEKLKLINYDTLEEFSRVHNSGFNSANNSKWVYTLVKERYDQLGGGYLIDEVSTLSSKEKQDKSILNLTYYLVSPSVDDAPLHTLAIGASLELQSGKKLTTADTGAGFNSYVHVTPIKPLEYYVNNEYEYDGGLTVSRKRIVNIQQDYGEHGWSHVYNYHVSISHPETSSRKIFTSSHSEYAAYPNERAINGRPSELESFPSQISDVISCFSVFCKDLYRNVCYYWNLSNQPGDRTVGVGGYKYSIDPEYQEGSLNFTSARFYCWPGQNFDGRITYRIKITFDDCYGNKGHVFVYPYDNFPPYDYPKDNSMPYLLASEIEFYSV